MRWLALGVVLIAIPMAAQISEQQLLLHPKEPSRREVRDMVNQEMTAAGLRSADEQDALHAPRPMVWKVRGLDDKGDLVEAVLLGDAARGAVIHYTVDGSRATMRSAVYTGPIPVKGKMRVRAMATVTGLKSSYEVKARLVPGK